MNTFKLTIKNVKHVINGNKVICNIEFEFRALPFMVAKVRNHKATKALTDNAILTMDNMKNQTFTIKSKGIATCSANDEFDENLGKKIAYSKALLEGYRKYLNILYTATDALFIKYKDISENANRVNNIIVQEREHLNKLKSSQYVKSTR